jgi:hypothetical protein
VGINAPVSENNGYVHSQGGDVNECWIGAAETFVLRLFAIWAQQVLLQCCFNDDMSWGSSSLIWCVWGLGGLLHLYGNTFL